MKHWLVSVASVAILVSGCAALRDPIDQRSTQGPTAEQLWTYRTVTQNGREPTFEERNHWDMELDMAVSRYLAAHPEVANGYDVSTFRYSRQVAVGMTKEQVLMLLGAPDETTSDHAQMEKLARKFWPQLEGNATEAWSYPLGWHLYFAGQRLIDITQHVPRE